MAILSSHRTGIVNVRDIGGYQAVDGMKVKKELLIRGTSLATAKDGYHFVKWSDGDTSNPRTLTINKKIELIAIFE